mmetsp:Transcript_41462/g.119511  ORF Transcript_41462/g.119511 Transcript_41462/m.119511 type:complete len:221 (+) Transcript_41462:1027-1689(+)
MPSGVTWARGGCSAFPTRIGPHQRQVNCPASRVIISPTSWSSWRRQPFAYRRGRTRRRRRCGWSASMRFSVDPWDFPRTRSCRRRARSPQPARSPKLTHSLLPAPRLRSRLSSPMRSWRKRAACGSGTARWERPAERPWPTASQGPWRKPRATFERSWCGSPRSCPSCRRRRTHRCPGRRRQRWTHCNGNRQLSMSCSCSHPGTGQRMDRRRRKRKAKRP